MIKPEVSSIKYHLSSEGFYFIYRFDKYNIESIRAELFRNNGESIKSITVINPAYGVDMTHTEVINCFEAEISLGVIVAPSKS